MKWFNYQSLWDLSPEMVYSTLGLDVDRWAALVSEIQDARSMIDNEESSQYFGPVLIKHVISVLLTEIGIDSV
jgi:dynein heavy chain 1